MNLLPNYKDIIELLKKGATIEAQEKIMELREGALALQEENIQLRERIKELENELNLKKNVIYEPPYYWLKLNDKKDGPFCQNCYDSKQKLIRLQSLGKGAWRCHSCDKNYFDGTFRSDESDYFKDENPKSWDDDL